jgi:hypothetical protein
VLKLLENFGLRVYFIIFISAYASTLEFYFGVQLYNRVVVSEERFILQWPFRSTGLLPSGHFGEQLSLQRHSESV